MPETYRNSINPPVLRYDADLRKHDLGRVNADFKTQLADRPIVPRSQHMSRMIVGKQYIDALPTPDGKIQAMAGSTAQASKATRSS